MALYLINPGDVALAEDINQIIRQLNGDDTSVLDITGTVIINGVESKLQTYSGSTGASSNVSIAHGLGRVPVFLLGYWGASQGAADVGTSAIQDGCSAVASGVYFRNVTNATATHRSADNSNIYVRNSSAGTIFYRIYAM